MKPLIILILLSLSQLAFSQSSKCKVLLEEIAGHYSGDCKKGKADGQGTAKGLHEYKGEFKKGKPYGQGVYIWNESKWYEGTFKNGMKDGYGELHSITRGEETLTAGYWRNNHYIGEEKLPDYEFTEKLNLERVSLRLKDVEGNTLRIHILRDKVVNNSVSNVVMTASSGQMRKGSASTVYENIEFPFEFNITYNTPNRFGSYSISCNVSFTIYTPGEWELKLEN